MKNVYRIKTPNRKLRECATALGGTQKDKTSRLGETYIFVSRYFLALARLGSRDVCKYLPEDCQDGDDLTTKISPLFRPFQNPPWNLRHIACKTNSRKIVTKNKTQKMAPSQLVLLLGILVFHILWTTQAAPAKADHPIVSKDTDENSLLKNKLGRIRELIAQLDAEGEKSELAKEKVAAQEKEMRSLGREDIEKFKTVAEGLKAHHAHKTLDPPKPTLPTEDSIEVLAQALARLRSSQADEPGSDGERMGTRYNQKIRLEKPEKEAFEETEMGKSLQQTIAEALARLQDEDQPPRRVQQPLPPSYKNFRDEAIRMVESHLLRDLALADKLGLSVDDLIQDFEEEESREENLMKLENSLASLIAERDD
ncbi:hypothetical protein RRG08_051186 [Elysia crispata]|uniref:Uncharacterized protein n=1 Tax=Elysia crispata TaxID=231223 RepID=A0AAE1DAL7_9GAST|nr:hypothetical protein RRG08_051186 [Elysia crispata]